MRFDGPVPKSWWPPHANGYNGRRVVVHHSPTMSTIKDVDGGPYYVTDTILRLRVAYGASLRGVLVHRPRWATAHWSAGQCRSIVAHWHCGAMQHNPVFLDQVLLAGTCVPVCARCEESAVARGFPASSEWAVRLQDRPYRASREDRERLWWCVGTNPKKSR